jgi:alkylation response protein AidB-like acyl-CoA dehydrogenase
VTVKSDPARPAPPTVVGERAYLDVVLGDPRDDENPLGYRAFLDADEQYRLLEPAERALDQAGLNAEFVPASLGGRLTTVDRLARVLRPLFARDAALGLSHGTSNLIGAVTVWAAGSPEQQRRLADVLLANRCVAPCYTDLDSGNDVARAGLRATPDGPDWRLSGTKEMINNLERAEMLTILARTGTGLGSREHSLLLVDRADLPREHVRWHPRYRTSAVRGLPLGGLDLVDCPVPGASVVGPAGSALETVLRAFQVTRAVLPSAAIGGWDTQLRVVLDFALSRRLYGGVAADLPYVRRQLTGAFIDLLIADSFSTTVCRALHLLPRHTSVYAPAVKYVVPILMRESVEALGIVLGARSFLRTGPQAIFQKHLRDLPVATLVHAGAAVCQATIIPQLPRLARSWPDGGPPIPVGVFRDDIQLDVLDLDRLSILMASGDPLIGVLTSAYDSVTVPRSHRLIGQLLRRLSELKAEVAGLRPRQTRLLAPPAAFDAAQAYALLLAAAAAIGVDQLRRGGSGGNDGPWLLLALTRLCERLGIAPEEDPMDAWDWAWAELLRRHTQDRAFDLTARPLY